MRPNAEQDQELQRGGAENAETRGEEQKGVVELE
jgi:hypothetical protein